MPMINLELLSKSSQGERWRLAARQLQVIFEEAGWKVKSLARGGAFEADLLVRRRKVAYVVELKAASEGRSDRLIPLFAQAALQVMRGASKNALPLAIVSAPRIPRRAAEQVLEFAARYAPDLAVGVFDLEGLRLFHGPQLEDLNAEPVALPPASRSGSARDSRHLFSDLNQWMLKVLLAPELPEHLLSAPRGRYINASQLAKAAQVSVMSAFRFVQQLQDEGYLHESPSSLELVRRPDLFARWQASNDRACREIDMRFRLPGDASVQLRKVLNSGRACLALFAAADALHLGFVQGVPPHVYVERVQPSSLMQWKNLRPCGAGEPPDVVLRQAAVPQSVFRGMVKADGGAASDVIQVWLDVAARPARGQEQANLIRQRVLDRIISKGK
ncbi:MAG: hypothetical protein H0W53_15075 [Acidobacteria bacterium]|nr:hypothetical protein [Acidobacteriota bacterium]